ncbi:hypothetical protein [Stenotrophomonas sp.]|uniref:hypothetical protein n=1 Tax=Stenotrophomonas sp. TaxID=69392 RepID=UPI0028A5FC77|nr:hypothetical protein [Stenotrophomonas sp.]
MINHIGDANKMVAAAPVDGPTEVEWMMACNEIGGADVAEEIITRAYSIAEMPRSTPAAPGIDLTIPDRIKQAHDKCKLWPETKWPGFEPDAGFTALLEIRNWVETLIDASSKGGESMRDWSLRMAKLEEGQHVGAGAHGLPDSPKGGSDA